MPSNHACQVTVVFSTIFDQAARTALSAFLIWSVSNGLDTQLKRIGLWMFVGVRFVLGAILAGFIRPQFADICVGKSSSSGFAIALIMIDGLILACLVSRMFTLGIWADTREVRSSTGKEQSKGLVALGLGYLLWFAMSIPMILGFAQVPLFFRTGFPAIGIVVLTVIINYFSGALALHREPKRKENHPYHKRGPSFDTSSNSLERNQAGQYLPAYNFSGREQQNSVFPPQPSRNTKELPRSFQGVREAQAQASAFQSNRGLTSALFQQNEDSRDPIPALQYLPELDFSTPTADDWLGRTRSTIKSKILPDGVISGATELSSGPSATQATKTVPVQVPSVHKKLNQQSQSISRSPEESNLRTVHKVKRKAIGQETSPRKATETEQISPLALPRPLTQDNSWLDMRASEAFEHPLVASGEDRNRTFYSDDVDKASPISFVDRPQRLTIPAIPIATPRSTLEASYPSTQSNSTIMRVPSPSRSLKRKQAGGNHLHPICSSDVTRASSATWVSPCSGPSHGSLSPLSPLSGSVGNSQPQSSPISSNVASIEAPPVSITARLQTPRDSDPTASLGTQKASTCRRRTLVVVDDLGNDEFFGDILVGTDTLELLFPAPPSTLVGASQSTPHAEISQVANHVDAVEQCLLKPKVNGTSKMVQLEACAPIALPELVVDTGSAASSRPSSAESAQAVGGRSRERALVATDAKSPKLSEIAVHESQEQLRRSSRRPSVVCVEGKLFSMSGRESRLTSSSTGLLAIHSKHRNSAASTMSERSRERVSIESAQVSGQESSNQPSKELIQHKHGAVEPDSVTEEIVTVMLDTEEASSIFWDTADDLRCFRIKPLTPSPKVRRKTMRWHCRIGDVPPTFSGRRKQRNSKTAPPPVPLLLGTRKSAPGTLGLNKPLPDESEAMRDIEEQLRRLEQPSNDIVKIMPQQSHATDVARNGQDTLMKTLDQEIGRQRKYWLDLHQNLSQDSSTTDEEGCTAPQPRKPTRKSSRPISRYSQIRDSFEAQTYTKPPIPSKSTRRASNHEPQFSSGDSPKQHSSGQNGTDGWQRRLRGQQTASGSESRLSTSNAVQVAHRRDVSWSDTTQNTIPKSSNDRPRTDRRGNTSQSSEILSTKVYKPITELWRPRLTATVNTANQIWTPTNVSSFQKQELNHHDATSRQHRRVPRVRDAPLRVSSTSLWKNKPAKSLLSHGLWGAKPNPPEAITPPKATRKPLRRSRRTTLLPDIVESPKPVPGKEGALGVFQWPWGPSDSAQIQPMHPPPPPPIPAPRMPEFTMSFDADEYEMATEAEDEYSSYFEDYDEDDLSAEDILDETGFWQLYSNVQCQAIPLKSDGFTSEVKIVEEYEDEQRCDLDANSVYDKEFLNDDASWEQKLSPEPLGDEYHFEGVALQHSPMVAT
ncbi:MAG: hypothetical protein M1812_006219 [Candelaria pacifica]|nr:MAG: hypothetical protein M1812_006219 [Candelaria pacifica]